MFKNQYLLFAVALLAVASTALNVALFVSERGNEHRLRELNQRLDQMELRQLPSLEERSSQERSSQRSTPLQAEQSSIQPGDFDERESTASAGGGTAQ
jgi:hypothetical protein